MGSLGLAVAVLEHPKGEVCVLELLPVGSDLWCADLSWVDLGRCVSRLVCLCDW